MRKHAIIITAVLAGGCLAKKLRAPVEDHFVQTQTIAERCKADCDPEELQEDLDAMAVQACLIDAIVKGNDGEQCRGDQ